MNNSLKGKVVLITGSSIGIGAETAKKFASEGCRLVVTFNKSKTKAQEVEKEFKNLGAMDVLLIQLDLTDDQSIRNVISTVINKFGNIDVLINNAGILIWEDFKDYAFEDIELELRTNLEGLIKITNLALPYIKDTIINIGSANAFRPSSKTSVYSASKFGIRGFSQVLAKEEPNLRIYVVNPTATATQMTDFGGQDPKEVAEVILKAAKGDYNIPSGSDINVWEVT